MLFASTDLATRIEAAECELLSASARAVDGAAHGVEVVVVPFAGGLAIWAGQGSPLNKVAGLGFAGPVDEAALQEVETIYEARGTPVQVELSALAEPSIGRTLTRRGYDLVGFENVLGTRLVATDPGHRFGEGGDVVVAPAAAEDFEAWLDVVVRGFSTPDEHGVPAHESFGEEGLKEVVRHMSRAQGMVRYLARREGALAGGASMRLGRHVAHLCGASTLPAHRRRGVQRALLGRRLADAQAAKCEVAVVTTLPGSTSQKNVQALGFQLLYTRAILVRAPATLDD
ncbi:MAG TPA: GNAT family N-acetyltransferase [Longimicrobiales bacterium]|nr:GNAT family N-acetyltransferase [Longimicrobiales bacterium]